ncbi:hypothetical protein [Gillisia sp. JM1]|uniref:hypothetical protein n=1 Tax=Gillisia sp. JM1 TaxID=1283286 RepID=UPI00040703F7|nr:hypothetical protein [Gillisia sp. JM1]
MGILYIPSEKQIKGPWFIGRKELEELDEILKFIDQKLKDSYENEIQAEAEEELKKKRFDNIEEARIYIQKSSFMKKIRKDITIISQDESKLKDSQLKDLLIDPKIKNFKPKELSIDIEYGYNNHFSLNIMKRFDGELKYKLECSDSEAKDEINYKIENWIESYKPKKIKQLWQEYSFPLIMLAGMIFLLSITSIVSNKSPTAVNVYSKDINKLIESGINEDNRDEAIELILKTNANYIPESVTSIEEFNATAIKLAIFSLICLLVFIFKPKTIIGVGKHKSLLNTYKLYTKMILVTIPAIFVLPFIYDFIKELVAI